MNDLVDGLRRVAALLPPNFTISANEAPLLLGAMIQYAEHGDDLVKAAEAGPQAVADFYHQAITDQAEAAGEDAPRQGAPVEKVSAGAPVTASGAPASAADVAKLTALVQQLAASVAAQQPQPEVTVTQGNAGSTTPPTSPPPVQTSGTPGQTAADQAGQDSQAEAGV